MRLRAQPGEARATLLAAGNVPAARWRARPHTELFGRCVFPRSRILRDASSREPGEEGVGEVRWRFGVPKPGVNALVLRRLDSLASLSAPDKERVLALPRLRRASLAGTELCAAGVAAARPCFLIEGWACRLRLLSDGRRQIFNLVLPGDLIGSCLRPSQPATAATVALTRVETASASSLAALLEGSAPTGGASLAAAFLALERQGETLLLDQITRLGRQTAYERMAHLLIEIRDRLAAVGLAEGDAFPWPLRQDVVADLLGLSVVHVSRTLQQLRRDGMIELRGGTAALLQPERLRAAADIAALPKAG